MKDAQSASPDGNRPLPDLLHEAVQQRLTAVPPTRLAHAIALIARHLHVVVQSVRPSRDEYGCMLQFLAELGHYTDSRRQEWVLLADVLGVSALVETLNAPRPAGATPDTGAGPFYRADAPELPLGADLSRDGKGERLRVIGQVRNIEGHSLSGAVVEVWHASACGCYENQQPDSQPEFNLRGRFRTDSRGRFDFLSVKPGGYALPSDGPVGRLMAALGCPLERPAHLHFRISAQGYQTLTTHIFDRADPAIGRDPIFGVRPELLADFRKHRNASGGREYLLDLTLVLCAEGVTGT